MSAIVRDGLTIHYECAGAGPAIVLLQGVGVAGSGWRPQVEALRSRWTVVTIDNRGIGGSTLDQRPLSVQDMAADVLAVADAEGLTSFHLAGHSLGGLIAQQVALTATSRVLSLALVCTFLTGRQGTALPAAMLPTALRARIGTRRMRRRAFVRLVMPDAYLATLDRDRLCDELGALFGRDLADQPPIVMRQLRAMGAFDASSRLHALADIPTLVISASDDCIARPAYGRALAAAIPGARYIEIAHAGHAVPIQCAAEVSGLLGGFFAEAEAAVKG